MLMLTKPKVEAEEGTLKFEVLVEDVEGADSSNTNCVVARALKRYTGKRRVSVGATSAHTSDDGLKLYTVDDRTAERICDFLRDRRFDLPHTVTLTPRSK